MSTSPCPLRVTPTTMTICQDLPCGTILGPKWNKSLKEITSEYSTMRCLMEGCNWYWPQTRTLLVLSGCKLSLETLTFERTSTITIFQNRHCEKLHFIFILFFTREIKKGYLFWRPLSPLQSGNRISNIRWLVTATSKFSLKSPVEWRRLSRSPPEIMLVHYLLSNLP